MALPFSVSERIKLSILSLGIFFVSCKENTLIRTNIVPAVDNIHVFGTDTLTLNTKTVLFDSVVTSAYVSGLPVYVGLGAVNTDPTFGKTEASFYVQVKHPLDNYSFDKTRYQVDSAVLILPFSGYCYGDTSIGAAPLSINAYRMTERIYADSTYYAHSAYRTVESTPIGSATVPVAALVASYRDSTTVAGKKYPSHIRVKLNSSLVNELVDNTGTSVYASTTNFLDFFKGIYVSTTNTANSIPYIRLTGDDAYTKAGILLYYHTINTGGAITDTLTIQYPFDPAASQTKTAFFAKIKRDYNASSIQSSFSSTALTDPQVGLQSQPGASLEISIPNCSALPTCVVNKAEIVLTQIAAPFDAIFAAPNRIYPMVVNEDGSLRQVADRLPLSSSSGLYFIDGNLRVASVGGALVQQYVLNIPKELQQAIVEKRKALKLRINGIQTFAGSGRVMLAGSNYSQSALKAKINIVYTKL